MLWRTCRSKPGNQKTIDLLQVSDTTVLSAVCHWLEFKIDVLYTYCQSKQKQNKITGFEKILKALLLVLQNLDSREMHISTYT